MIKIKVSSRLFYYICKKLSAKLKKKKMRKESFAHKNDGRMVI